MAALLGLLVLLAAAMPAAALAQLVVPHVQKGSEPSSDSEPAFVVPHVYVGPLHPSDPVAPPVSPPVTPPPDAPPVFAGPAGTPTRPASVPVAVEAAAYTKAAAHGVGFDTGACGIECQRDWFEYTALGLAGKFDPAHEWAVRTIVAQMKQIKENIARLRGGTPGVSEPTFLDVLKESFDVASSELKQVLAPIYVTELVSNLFGTAPACGVKKGPEGTPTCIK